MNHNKSHNNIIIGKSFKCVDACVSKLSKEYTWGVSKSLFPLDPVVRQRRVRFKGNKKKNFTEGLVEFHDKRFTKTVALMLNNTPIGGKKRSYYHDDLWNIKYLPKFRWIHLMV